MNYLHYKQKLSISKINVHEFRFLISLLNLSEVNSNLLKKYDSLANTVGIAEKMEFKLAKCGYNIITVYV